MKTSRSESVTTPNLCIKYRREKYNKWVRLWDEWKPLELWDSPWKYFHGNMATFGKWRGFWATIDLMCPLFNKLRHWKYRDVHLDIPYSTKDTLGVIEGDKK